MSNETKHPLRQHPEKVRTSYLTLLASMANADGKIEAPAHFARTFLEQRKFHIGLAQGFAADSDVAKALQASLEQALPNDDKAALKGFLDDWLTFRRERAQHVADAMLLDGEMVQTSVAEWEAQRLGKLQALTSDNENTKETPKEAAAATSPVANDNGTTPAPNVAVPEKPAMAHAVQEIPPSILNAVNIAQDNIKQIEEKIATGTGRA